MSSLIACPGCNHKLTLPDDFAGQRVKCPKCALEFAALATPIPAMEVDTAPPPGNSKPVEAPKNDAVPPPLPGAYTSVNGPSEPERQRRATAPDAAPRHACPECGAEYPRTDDSCPKCGYRNFDLLAQRHRERRRTLARDLPPVSGLLAVLAAFMVPAGVGVFFLGPLISEGFRRPGSAPFVIGVIATVFGSALVLLAIVFCLIWLYQAWRVVLEYDEDYSPGLMVGLLAIPFFNFYWMFRAVPGLSSALQRELHSIAPARSNHAGWAAGLVACIFMLIPYFQPVAVCIFIGWMLIANNAVHRLIRIHARLRAEEEADDQDREDKKLDVKSR